MSRPVVYVSRTLLPRVMAALAESFELRAHPGDDQPERAEVLATAIDAVKLAVSLSPDVEFSCEDATRSDRDFLCRVVEGAIAAGWACAATHAPASAIAAAYANGMAAPRAGGTTLRAGGVVMCVSVGRAVMRRRAPARRT